MARGLNAVVALMVVLVASTQLQYSAAQTTTTHQVGDALGWSIPPATTGYSTWASTKTFTVGDVLVFNYTTGVHNVVEVSKADLDACNSNNPISISTAGPTSITLSTAGDHHFICSVGQHCSFGQKLSVNVSAAATATSPAPTPAAAATPSPSPTPVPAPSPVSMPAPGPSPVVSLSPAPVPVPVPAPGPSGESETYIVGDGMGWVVPPAGAVAYQTWALNKTFLVGDTLVFNFFNGAHNVAKVSKQTYESCNTTAVTNPISGSPARITLSGAGEHFFICAVPTHCTGGQKLAINVTGTGLPPAGSPTQTPSSGGLPPSSGTPSPADDGVPPSSAPSFAVTALPVTLLAAAMALLY